MLNMVVVCYFGRHGVSMCTALMNILYFMLSIKTASTHYYQLYTTYFNVCQLHVMEFSMDICHLLMWSLVYWDCEFESCLGHGCVSCVIAVCLSEIVKSR